MSDRFLYRHGSFFFFWKDSVGCFNRFLFQPCFRPDLASFERDRACLFSSDYLSARYRFRDATKLAGGVLESIEVKDGLTIDIAIFQEELCKKKMLLIHSGVHGVEGFSGSAIQLGVIKEMSKYRDVCVVLVHAVNPYGFSELRRWNENGVDLNRNALFTKEAWDEVLNRDPNIAGYEEHHEMFCPYEKPSIALSVAKSLIRTMRFGKAALKKALVTATYHQELCLFFGGKEIQPSLKLLSEFYRRKGFLQTKKVFLIDVHSGLGPKGMDSLMTNDDHSYKVLSNLVTEVPMDPKPYSVETLFDNEAGSASEGYELMRGDCMVGFMSLFSNETEKVSVAQEFGTYDTFLVIQVRILSRCARRCVTDFLVRR